MKECGVNYKDQDSQVEKEFYIKTQPQQGRLSIYFSNYKNNNEYDNVFDLVEK